MQTGSFGNIIFMVSSGRTLTWGGEGSKRNVSSRFATHDLIGRKPLLEHTGPGLDSFTLEVSLQTSLGVSPHTELRRLEAMCSEGKAHNLILGDHVFHKYVLKEVGHGLKTTDGLGRLTATTTTLSLTEYSETPMAAAAAASREAKKKSGLEEALDGAIDTVTESPIGKAFMEGTAAAQAILAGAADVAQGITEAVEGVVSTGLGFVQTASDVYNAASSLIRNPSLASLASMQGVLNDASRAYPFGSLDQLQAALEDSTAVVGGVCEQIYGLVKGTADPEGGAKQASSGQPGSVVEVAEKINQANQAVQARQA